MIGGRDVVVPIGWDAACRDRILRLFLGIWPEGRYEDAESGFCADLITALASAPDTDEFFVYRDIEAARRWDADGAASEDDSMVHIVGAKYTTTIVVGSDTERTAALIAQVANVIGDGR